MDISQFWNNKMMNIVPSKLSKVSKEYYIYERILKTNIFSRDVKKQSHHVTNFVKITCDSLKIF